MNETHTRVTHTRVCVCPYLYSIVTVYFKQFLRYSVSKNGMTLKSIRGCSRSVKMMPFNRPCTTFYWLAIVSIALFVPFSSQLTLNNITTLKYGLFKMVPFKSLDMVSYSWSIVTMALSCIISKIKWDTGWKSRFFIPSAFEAPVRWVPIRVLPYHLVWKKLEWYGYPTVKKWRYI